MKPFISSISESRRPLATSCAIEARQLRPPAAVGVSEPVEAVTRLELPGIRPSLGGRARERGHAVAEGEPDPGGSAARAIISVRPDLAGNATSRGAEPGIRPGADCHPVLRELGPALPPEVVGRPRAVDDGQHLRELLGARRDPLVVLADAEDVVPGAPALLDAALHLARRPTATPILDMTRPTTRPAPAACATTGSGQQFWADTTYPCGAMWRSASGAAHTVSYAFIATTTIS